MTVTLVGTGQPGTLHYSQAGVPNEYEQALSAVVGFECINEDSSIENDDSSLQK